MRLFEVCAFGRISIRPEPGMTDIAFVVFFFNLRRKVDGYYRAVKCSTFSRAFLSAFSDFFFFFGSFLKLVYDFDEIANAVRCKEMFCPN